MFDIGWSELVLLGVVALVVLGPERLPEVAVTAGRWMGRLQRLWALTKVQMEQELRIKAPHNTPEATVLPDIKNILQQGARTLSSPVSFSNKTATHSEQMPGYFNGPNPD